MSFRSRLDAFIKIMRDPSVLGKVASGGGFNFKAPRAYSESTYGPGTPIPPLSQSYDTEIPRSIDYTIAVNSQITPRSGYGLMPYGQMYFAYDAVTECKLPVWLITRELSSLVPHLVDKNGKIVQGHDYQWMCEYPDGVTPFRVWATRLLKSTLIYDAPAVYFGQSGNLIDSLYYIDGSTLFVIVDQYGNTPAPEPIDDYVQRLSTQGVSERKISTSESSVVGPSSLQDFVSQYVTRAQSGKEVPDKIPAFTQIIKGTPFSWWSSDQIWYMPQQRRTNAPYGESFIEGAWTWINIIANITGFELSHYRTGNMPEGYVTLPKEWLSGPDQLNQMEMDFNERMTENPALNRNRLRILPDGSKFEQTKKADFPQQLYRVAFNNILHAIGVPPSEFGDVPGGGLGGKGFKEGASSDLSRNTINPRREFIVSPFNYALRRNGVTDVTLALDYTTEEIDPDKLRQSTYEGMAHGTLSLNEARGQLNLDPIGDPNDKNNIANKHIIVAGSTVIVVEDAETQNGMIIPQFGPDAGNRSGGKPIGPESTVEQDGKEHTPDDIKTIERIMKNIVNHGTIDGHFISIPSNKSFAHAISPIKKANATHSDGAMIAVMIPSEVANQLRQITEEISLPSSASLELATNMHVTLAYLPDASVAEGRRDGLLTAIRQVAQSNNPLTGKIQGFGVFNGSNNTKVLFALLDEPQLPFIRTAICTALDEAGIEYSKDYGFVPHVTMAYFPETFELPAGFTVPDIPVEINILTLAFGTDLTSITLGQATAISKLAKHCGVCLEDDEYFGAPISREATFNFPNTRHANGVEIVAMTPEGLPAKSALWKPEGSEVSGLQEWVGGPQYIREEAAYLIDRSLGFYLVPVTYVAESYGEMGAAVYYSHDMPPAKDPDGYAPFWTVRAAVLDYVISQQDRGYHHNYATHPDDPTRMILFDNGLCLPEDTSLYCNSPFCDLWANKEFPDDVLAAMAMCRGDASTWSDVRSLVGYIATQKALTCLQRLIDEKMITVAIPSLTAGVL